MSARRVTLVSALSSFDSASPDTIGLSAPPLGVLTLASVLRQDYDVQVIDLDEICRRAGGRSSKFREAAVDGIIADNPQVLGFSSVSGSYPNTIGLAELASSRLPGVPIILGGPQASVVDVETLRSFPFVDFILRGEADQTFPALLKAIFDNEEKGCIAGLTFRSNDRIVRNPNASVLLDMDQMPLPAFDLHPRIRQLESLPIEAGRGCPFSCRFCSTNDFFRRKFRLKSAARLLGEMNHLHEIYGVKLFDFVHDMFTVDRRKVAEFCDVMIEAGSPYLWSCSARTDCVDAELLQMMKKAGCVDVFFGIETGSQRMQAVIDKGLDLQESRRVLSEVDRLGMSATASLIAGYPEETLEDFQDTVRFFSDTMQYPHVSPKIYILSPLAQTPLTTQYWNRLYLHEDWPEITENGLGQSAEDRALIIQHTDVFPNFLNFPTELEPAYLRRARDFLFYGAIRCEGLLQALYRRTGNLLSVFDQFDRIHGPKSGDWFNGREFAGCLVSFAAEFFSNDASVAVMVSFYQAVLDAEAAQDSAVPSQSEPNPIGLRPGVQIISCQGDVNAVFKALREGCCVDPAAKNRMVTLVIRTMWPNRAEILEFPAVSLDLLRHAQQGSTIEEMIADLERRDIQIGNFDPAHIVPAAIDLFEQKKLVYRTTQQPARLCVQA